MVAQGPDVDAARDGNVLVGSADPHCEVLFAAAVCLACSVIVATASVGLRARQDVNRVLDRQKKVLTVAGLIDEGEDVEASRVAELFEKKRPRRLGHKATTVPSTPAVLAYAAGELARYLRQMTGTAPHVLGVRERTDRANAAWLGICDQVSLPNGTPSQAALTPAPWDDGYALWADEEGLTIAGRNARSVLFGVYAFLERQGVRFLRPGGYEGEVIPWGEPLWLPEEVVVEQPRYRHRGVCIEGAPSIAHVLDMVDWCAKKRLNTVFLQFLSSRYFYNLWYERPYNPDHSDRGVGEEEALALDDQVIASMKERGLVLHRVGHGWTSAAFGMPRSGWVTADEEVPPQVLAYELTTNGPDDALFSAGCFSLRLMRRRRLLTAASEVHPSRPQFSL